MKLLHIFTQYVLLVFSAEEDPPEYDVAARVRQLNEELANDPTPDDDRERSIKFKDNLVDLVAPPPDYDTEDEDQESDHQSESNGNDNVVNDNNEPNQTDAPDPYQSVIEQVEDLNKSHNNDEVDYLSAK